MENLTIQAFLQREWVDIAQISFPRSDENNWRITELHYQSDYAIEYLECTQRTRRAGTNHVHAIDWIQIYC
ncbi:hypothetical protein [Pseudocitrobacter sp. 73]|uniref:hypothetical protein n=1 Tax=Pseudocitrobacter sp. 73 TaxID=2605731 RepID=UPI00165E1D20|nr:hypothetical protein [Pseudocitrobacter sp. 73]